MFKCAARHLSKVAASKRRRGWVDVDKMAAFIGQKVSNLEPLTNCRLKSHVHVVADRQKSSYIDFKVKKKRKELVVIVVLIFSGVSLKRFVKNLP